MRYSTGFETLLFASVLFSFPLMAASQTNEWITEEDRFINLIDGKILKRFLIELSVLPGSRFAISAQRFPNSPCASINQINYIVFGVKRFDR